MPRIPRNARPRGLKPHSTFNFLHMHTNKGWYFTWGLRLSVPRPRGYCVPREKSPPQTLTISTLPTTTASCKMTERAKLLRQNLLSEKELVKPHIHEILRANYMCIGNLWGKGDGGLSLDGNWNFFIICLAQECKAAVWRGMWDLAAGLGVQVKCHAGEGFYCTLACLGKGSQL